MVGTDGERGRGASGCAGGFRRAHQAWHQWDWFQIAHVNLTSIRSSSGC
jgi:hypothetical protein